ncbi:T9SS type A sorting domain-containing protein [Flavobacterium sp. DGU11]|uniref:T9SS type A sorting domain-containing protein n=1 Tax=Flavobacterium arundinis TaxID=3139143 RepID=A0ABU9HS45_9FLAO
MKNFPFGLIAAENAYPNPASGIVTLELPSSATAIEGSLYDLPGREVLRISGTGKMDVSGVSNGIFMLNATADGKSFTKKIIVNH